ncbi:CPBP family intramembrane metalloprotease [Psychrobacillus glaciei]|uniref:CPBP family intramembrane metalloprotease n=1 Tax=Psychrobacillus glaciei TaxID=2283160 RepID=A0A5J6SQH6_9BACI|nr:type II CAAX endopeptidase family protein [Psychrobacillus glaciei]QFF99773.1 CPBP family intramembrane metalloprotease [Psychrobacillus glaciei]
MLKQIILLIGPTIMIFIGLSLVHNVLITFFLFYGWLLFIPLIIVYWNKENRNSNRIQIPLSKKSLLVGAVSGLICLITIYSFVFIFQSFVLDIPQLQQLLEEWDFSGKKVILLVLVLALINPILEEFYWREFMYSRLLPKIGNVTAIMITSIFYSLYHLIVVMETFSFPFNALAVVPVFLAGIMWAIFRYKLKSITAPIISHCLADIGIMLVYWYIIVPS